ENYDLFSAFARSLGTSGRRALSLARQAKIFRGTHMNRKSFGFLMLSAGALFVAACNQSTAPPAPQPAPAVVPVPVPVPTPSPEPGPPGPPGQPGPPGPQGQPGPPGR